MNDSTWTMRTFEDGEVARVETGLSRTQAVLALYRATYGEDPFARRAARLESASRAVRPPRV